MKQIRVRDTNLFEVAARELGDATQWIRIAQLNGLTDPMLVGLFTLDLPTVDASLGGGIAPQ